MEIWIDSLISDPSLAHLNLTREDARDILEYFHEGVTDTFKAAKNYLLDPSSTPALTQSLMTSTNLFRTNDSTGQNLSENEMTESPSSPSPPLMQMSQSTSSFVSTSALPSSSASSSSSSSSVSTSQSAFSPSSSLSIKRHSSVDVISEVTGVKKKKKGAQKQREKGDREKHRQTTEEETRTKNRIHKWSYLHVFFLVVVIVLIILLFVVIFNSST